MLDRHADYLQQAVLKGTETFHNVTHDDGINLRMFLQVTEESGTIDDQDLLRHAGFKVKDVVMNSYDGMVNIIQLEVDGAQKTAAHYGKLAGMTLLASLNTDTPPKYVIVVGPDINPYDWNDVMWAVGTRSSPVVDFVMVEKGRSFPDAGALLSRSVIGAMALGGEQVVIDATIKIPERWERFPPHSDPSAWEQQAIDRIRRKLST